MFRERFFETDGLRQGYFGTAFISGERPNVGGLKHLYGLETARKGRYLTLRTHAKDLGGKWRY